MCDGSGVTEHEKQDRSALAAYGPLDTCSAVMRAYRLYKYDRIKEKYEKHGNDHEQYRIER